MLRGKKSLPWDWKAPSALMLPGGLKGGYLYHVNRHYVKVIIEPSEGHGQKHPKGPRWASHNGEGRNSRGWSSQRHRGATVW
jgi:hypothetical protein